MKGKARPAGADEWLVGSRGVWAGRPDTGWRRLGPYQFSVNTVVRGEKHFLIGTGHGLWQAPADPAQRWTQLHDETLTEVMDVATDGARQTVAAGSYGVHVAAPDELGLPRWRSLTETRSPNERFTNRLIIDGDLWLAGTEAGLLRSVNGGVSWDLDDELRHTAVRGLLRDGTGWWAGSDERGLWRSEDGHAWASVPSPAAVFDMAVDGDGLLVGSTDGIHVRPADGDWRRCGPRALIRRVATRPGLWLAGADPGGLWASTDAGASWQRTGDFTQVRAIEAPTEIR